jgi:hypothetical protein
MEYADGGSLRKYLKETLIILPGIINTTWHIS